MSEVRRVPYPGTEGAPTDSPHDMNHMVQIDKLIADMQSIRDRFGNTCVYVRRGGLSWGAVALNRRADDEKYGLFDLQAEHDRVLLQRAGQVERLIADRSQCEDKLGRLRAVLHKIAEDDPSGKWSRWAREALNHDERVGNKETT